MNSINYFGPARPGCMDCTNGRCTMNCSPRVPAPKTPAKFCAVCLEPQLYTFSGITCKNGHGGADSLAQPYKTKKDRQAMSRAAPKCKCGAILGRYAQESGIDLCGRCQREATEPKLEFTRADLIRAYNTGYMSGHHDTVEGSFTDIQQTDMDTYHDSVVDGLIEAGELGNK